MKNIRLMNLDKIMMMVIMMALTVAFGHEGVAQLGLTGDHISLLGMGVGIMFGTTAPFPITPELTAVAVAYKNNAFIADDVLPRVPVGNREFKYRKYALGDSFTIPNTMVGRASQPNKIEFGFTETSAIINDYGLEDPIPQSDIDVAPPQYNPQGHATEQLTNLILLDREKRVADLVFDATNFGSSNKSTLSSTSQWSDYTNSNPIDAIAVALDACIMRPNIMLMGRAVYSKLAQHPRIVKAVNGTTGDTGIVRRQAIADMFEVQQILVGEGWYNSAKAGQTATLVRLWGKHCALLYRDRLADARSGMTFGFTAQYQGRIAGSAPDRNIGLRGGVVVRVGESVKEVITANDLGYLFTNAVA